MEVCRSMTDQPSILLIEDESRLRHNLQVLLQEEGYWVVTTDNGAEGIRQLEAQSFDLVITDLVMPGIDGFQVLDYLNVHRPETVAVTLTGYISLEFAAAALERGAYDYITKPFDYDLFRSTIERALEQARPRPRPSHHGRATRSTQQR
jgi:DNA-binding NtrC family response regulator